MSEKYIIHTCPERMWYVGRYLVPSMRAQDLDVEVRCDSKRIGNLEHCMQIFRSMPDDNGGAWHMQDDVIICRDFAERTKEHDDNIVCGFVIKFDGNLRYEGQTVPKTMWWSFPCIYIPNRLARECAEWFDRVASQKYADRTRTGKLDDWFFKKFLKINYSTYHVINLRPNLVDHIDYLIGGTVVNKDRNNKKVRSAYFEDKDLVNELEEKLKSDTRDDCKYIIMCGGDYKNFSKPKQLIEIGGEPIVARTIRLLREHGINDIAISSNNPAFDGFGIPVLKHDNHYDVYGYNNVRGTWVDAFYPMDTPVCYLMGDVVYSDDAINTIVTTCTDDIEFFASAPPFSPQFLKESAEPFGFKVFNTKRFRECIEKAKVLEEKKKFKRHPIAWELWQVIKGTPINKIDYTNYVAINDYTCDIDYESEVEMIREFGEVVRRNDNMDGGHTG